MKKINKKIVYSLTRWYEGTAYKDYQLMKDNFGGEIIEGINKIKSMNPDLMFCFGDVREAYKMPLEHNIPYVLIEQDVYSMRCGLNARIEKHDREKIENASAVIFTSEDHAKYYEDMKKKYGWKLPYYKVIHTRPLKKDLDFIPRQKMPGLNLVYAGGLLPKWKEHIGINQSKDWFSYRCYHKIFESFIKAGWKVHVYAVNELLKNRLNAYKDIGCIIHDYLPYKELIREMSQYTAGLHSYNKINVPKIAYNYTQSCRPNKIWDYLAAGIPTIGYQGGNGMKIYDGKWGIIIDDLEIETLNKIPERLSEIKITKRMRFSNTIDRDLKKFREIIEKTLKIDKVKKYVVPELISKAPFPKFITVENRGKRLIERANHIFNPDKETEIFQVNESDFRLIKAHVHLKINIKEN